jgi:hypothetical protein
MADRSTDFTATQDCVIASSSAVCKESASGSEAVSPGSSTTTYESSMIGRLTVMVTAGTDKLVRTGSVGESSSAIASQIASTASITPTPGSSITAASSSASRTSSVPAQASTAGAAVNAIVMGGGFSGAAAAVFGGLLL